MLVVEDNPDMASFAAGLLEGLRRAPDAAAALALLEGGRPGGAWGSG
jgi:CheY-like chemotaxis protein